VPWPSLSGIHFDKIGSFIHTWMPEHADKLIMENINKSIVELDEYPAASFIHNRCISMREFALPIIPWIVSDL
jgi:glutamate decarboxylase